MASIKIAKKQISAKKPARVGTKADRDSRPPISRPSKATSSRGDLAPERVAAILRALDEAYPNAVCALNHKTPWELLVATILSAQCTDVRVNLVTPELFRRFPSPAAMAAAPFPSSKISSAAPASSATRRNRSRERPGDCGALRRRDSPHSGRVDHGSRRSAQDGQCRPRRLLWAAEGVVVDTHVFRIARRLHLAKGESPEKVERN